MTKILVLEDEASIRSFIVVNLKRHDFEVVEAASGEEALEKLDNTVSVALLDVMLPGISGFEVCKRAREQYPGLGIIMLTAKGQEENKIEGLELGADDYLPKPFHLAELNARIKSVIRRNQHDGEIDIRQGNVRIEPDKYRVFVNEQELELNRKEYDILLYFINRPGRLVNKNTLAESVWGDHIDQVDNFDFIYAQIKNLRKKLKDAEANIEIKAVYGFGYKLIVE